MTYEESLGEEIIKEFFKENDIKYKPQHKIENLKGDSYPHRKADFYLPQYKVFVEFLGQWNQKEHKSRYKEKMAVYKKNEKPCVYIWPDNLGILNWVFKRRLKKELKKHKLKWQLFKYNCKLFNDEHYSLITIGGLVLIYFTPNWIVRFIILFFILATLYKGVKETFLK